MVPDPNVLVGLAPADDAAVVRLSDDVALVFTTDFFTPLVDDPRTFGRIAAANALSDVYAMGARPLVALNIVCFPTKTLGIDVLGEILAGGNDIARVAGISIAGGHSVEDSEPKYGLAVLGLVHPTKVWRKGGARPGDRLVLTKALGTGILSTALKRGKLTEDAPAMRAAIASMTLLNARAAALVEELSVEVHAATDITGYGLAGHLAEMLRASDGVGAFLSARSLPLLDDALAFAREGVMPGGTKANRAHLGALFEVADGVDEALAWLACDAQTSGGLLFALSAQDATRYVDAARALGLRAADIGTLLSRPEPIVRIEP
jgi:selenide,water dikinase